MKVLCVIPARYASTRFPGKPLADIMGKTMIRRVYERVCDSGCGDVCVATDDKRILDEVHSFGGKAIMTGEHRSGTDRCFEAFDKLGRKYDAVINIQGDEPLIDPMQIRQIAESLEKANVSISTLAAPIRQADELFDENVVKVVVDKLGNAMYFSRNSIPFVRGRQRGEWMANRTFLKHIGMYGFRAEAFCRVAALQPSELESAESLEQLRWLENGIAVHVELTDSDNLSVDTPDDLIKIAERLKSKAEK